MEKLSRVPCILHMDSIRGSHKGLKNLIRSYLLEEWKERHKEVTEDVARKFLNLPFFCLKLPQQDNSFDCGLFLLHYLELFLEEAPVNFNPIQITAPSKFLTEDWFSTEDVACKREYIKGLISEITKERVQKVSPAHFDVEEENTSMNFLQATQHTREACHDPHAGEFVTLSPVTNLIRGLQSAAVSEVVPGDLSLAGDSAKPLTDDNYLHYGQKAQRNLFRNGMSPIEEEAIGEQMSISPAIKAGSQHIEPFAPPHASSNFKSETLLLERFSRSPDTEKVTPVCQSNGRGSPDSLDVEEEEDLRAKAEEVPSRDAAKYDSSEELAGYIVLDSQDEDENHDLSGLANNLPAKATTSALIHKEVDASDIFYDHNVNEMIPSSQLLEQAAKKPRHVPDVIEVSSSGKGKDKFVSLSTSSEEVEICFVQDSEEVNSQNLKPAAISGNDYVTGKTRHLFRHPRRVRIDPSDDLIVHH